MSRLIRSSLPIVVLLLITSPLSAEWERVASGVEYQRFESDRRDIHVTRIDLTDEGLRVIGTQESERGLRVSEYARRNEAIVAINGDYFDTNMNPIGLTIGPCGQWEGTRDTTREGVVAIGPSRAEIHRQSEVMDPPEEWVEAAVSGWPALVMGCKPLAKLPGSDPFTRSPHPRTAVGLSRSGRTLFLIVADGRREGVPGLTLPELARFLAEELGACSAINLDGGGSSAMWLDGKIVNRPSDGSERRVADHLAVVRKDDFIGCDDPPTEKPKAATREKSKSPRIEGTRDGKATRAPK